jgi:hypothetical protein
MVSLPASEPMRLAESDENGISRATGVPLSNHDPVRSDFVEQGQTLFLELRSANLLHDYIIRLVI